MQNVCRIPIATAMPVLAVSMLLGAGCTSKDDGRVTVPSSPALSVPSGNGPTTTQSPMSPRDQVIAAYRGYTDATERAAAQPLDQARKTLATYSTPGLIEDQITGIRRLQAKNQEPWGKVRINVYAVEIQGPTARLSDCQDGSESGLADKRTHQLIPGTRGRATPYNLAVTLRRGADAQWRVSSVQPVETPCTPPPSSSGT